MIIREATTNDLPSIVELLKISLGESLMPKSINYWRWKHLDNPFGESVVLLAEENNQIIGVRAFMHWQWKKGGSVLKAVRAVDTATHPSYQGRGIFKNLTLKVVDICIKKNIHLVFNTPNQSSMPGYLKMGWEQAGRIPVSIGVNRPFHMLFSMLFSKNRNEFLKTDVVKFDLPEDLNFPTEVSKWKTNYSKNYLRWRYLDIPTINYYSFNEFECTVIFRLIKSQKGEELRIVDVFGNDGAVKKALHKIRGTLNYDFISIQSEFQHIIPNMLKKRVSGPMVTIRKLNYNVDDFINFSNWQPTLGDLEVF